MMKAEDVMKCSFSAWYETFEDVTIRSIILQIPPEFVDYLQAESVVLPEGSHQGAYSSAVPDESDDEDAVDWTSSEGFEEAKMPDCKVFLKEIDDAIARLGKKVFPKLNWSCPQDAKWVSFNNSLQCQHSSDVCLLLKSSTFITHDLMQPFVHCDDGDVASEEMVVKHELVLRRWEDINISQEFRCFVRHGKLIGISQRNVSQFFKHILDSKQEIQEDIVEFFDEVVDGNFGKEGGCYTFDVWRKKKNNVLLIDFNPFGPVASALLFDWEELTACDGSEDLMFRCVKSEQDVRGDSLAQFSMPLDVVHLSTGQDPMKLVDLLKLSKKNQGQHSSSSSSSSSDSDNDNDGDNEMLEEKDNSQMAVAVSHR